MNKTQWVALGKRWGFKECMQAGQQSPGGAPIIKGGAPITKAKIEKAPVKGLSSKE